MYKFIKVRDPNNEFDICDIEIKIDSSSVTLTELVEVFEDFLKSCSYGLDGKSIEIVEKEEECCNE